MGTRPLIWPFTLSGVLWNSGCRAANSKWHWSRPNTTWAMDRVKRFLFGTECLFSFFDVNFFNWIVTFLLLRLLRVEERNTTSSYCMGSVKLNNSYSMNGEQRLDESDGQQLTWPWRIHLGGRPSNVPTPDEILFLPGMMGCAYSLQVLHTFVFI